MDFKRLILRSSTFLLLLILLFVFACSTPSWFPIKKGSSPKVKAKKDLMDKEVVIIDKEEYVKVYNPKAPREETSPNTSTFPLMNTWPRKRRLPPLSYRKEEPKKGTSSIQPSPLPGIGDQFTVSPPKPCPSRFKEKGGHHPF